MRKVFVKTTTNEFLEGYLKSIEIPLCGMVSIKVSAGNVEKCRYYNTYYYNTVDDVIKDNRQCPSELLGSPFDLIERHTGLNIMQGNGETCTYIYFWDGNKVKQTYASNLNHYISGFIYDWESRKLSAVAINGWDRIGKDWAAAEAIINNERSFMFNGVKYFFTEKECLNSSESKVIIHRLDDEINEEEKLKNDIILRLDEVIKMINTEKENIGSGRKLLENGCNGLENIVKTIESIMGSEK